MKIAKLFAGVFGAIGTVLLVGSIGLCLLSLNAQPRVAQVPEAAVSCSGELMDSIASGDLAAAAEKLYGRPDLGIRQTPSDVMGAVIWDAFLRSFSCEFKGEYYILNGNFSRDAAITSLEIPSVTEKLQLRAHALLTQKVEAATDMDQLYDEAGEFRQELVEQVLQEALAQALAEDARLVTRDVTLTLIQRDGQWWVVPDEALLQAISGGVA